MKRNHPESALQRVCVKWFRLQYPKYANLLFAIPNGGRRSRIEAAIMKGEGVTPGVPDLFLAIPSGIWGLHGLFIEMKSAKGVLSPAQKEMDCLLTQQRYMVHPCNSLEKFIWIIEKYLNGKSDAKN